MAKSTKKRALPTNVALDSGKQKEFNQKVEKFKKTKGSTQPGVVYLSHIPWGFEENSMKEFFTQFGDVKQLRIAKSSKTGNTKGFAYIQFAHDEVAKIVAETMNNYIMFGKLLKCKHLEKPLKSTFKGANKPFKLSTNRKKAIEQHNSDQSSAKTQKNSKKALDKYRKKKNKMAELGIDYQVPYLEEQLAMFAKIKSEIFSDDEKTATNETDEVKSNKKAKLSDKTTPKKSTKRQSIIPKMVDTPQGKMNVLVEDSSEDEITFLTPPMSIKSSKLDDSVRSVSNTPKNTIAKSTPGTKGKKTKKSSPKQTKTNSPIEIMKASPASTEIKGKKKTPIRRTSARQAANKK